MGQSWSVLYLEVGFCLRILSLMSVCEGRANDVGPGIHRRQELD